MADWTQEPTFSASPALPRRETLRGALIRWEAARNVALDRPDATDADYDTWGGAVDRVVGATAQSLDELALKVQVMVTERRGGEGCLIAILNDIEALGGRGVAHA